MKDKPVVDVHQKQRDSLSSPNTRVRIHNILHLEGLLKLVPKSVSFRYWLSTGVHLHPLHLSHLCTKKVWFCLSGCCCDMFFFVPLCEARGGTAGSAEEAQRCGRWAGQILRVTQGRPGEAGAGGEESNRREQSFILRDQSTQTRVEVQVSVRFEVFLKYSSTSLKVSNISPPIYFNVLE